MPDERTPKEIHKTTCEEANDLYITGLINFREFNTLVARANTVYEMNKVDASDEKITNPQYNRTFTCGVCGLGVTARRIINGWILQCGCGEVFNRDFDPSNSKTWKRRDG